MKANAAPVLALFEKKHRLEVPLFQRQYVWNRGHQWEPLWEDISRKFTEYLEGRKDAPVHFLGAMVFDQKQTPVTHVEKRHVIDGQQRLTTIQIFLAAFRDFCRTSECFDLADECESFTLNKGMMAEPGIDKYKVWPTQLDRPQFIDVIISGSRSALETKHPITRRKYSRKPDPRPKMVEAYLFFYDSISDFFLGTPSDPPLANEQPIAVRLEECFQALKSSLQVVVIDLEQDDDAQVIFETLNARGEPLLPADLLRNYIFLRAARRGEPHEPLYDQYWKRFDEPFWREEVRQGRLSRPRSDLFMQHFLASQQGIEIPIKHLFVEYKFWIEKHKPFASVHDEVATLARQGEEFRRLITPVKGDAVFDVATFLERFDVGTALPALLLFLDYGLSPEEWMAISKILESYVLRRSVCGFTTKNYNRIFLTLVRTLRADGVSSENLRSYLARQEGESVEWPSDEVFRNAWNGRHAYHTLNNAKIVHIFRRLNDTYMGALSEQVTIESPLSVEHILPQNWLDHWPLPDGSSGLAGAELWETDEADPRAQATRRRNEMLQTLGNLTVLSQPLNSKVSNASWEAKKPQLLAASLLPINQQLYSVDKWDETAIDRRSNELFERALRLWPSPTARF